MTHNLKYTQNALFAFPWQQWLRERASHRCIICILPVFISYTRLNEWLSCGGDCVYCAVRVESLKTGSASESGDLGTAFFYF